MEEHNNKRLMRYIESLEQPKKTKWQKAKEKVCDGLDACGTFCTEHYKELIVILPLSYKVIKLIKPTRAQKERYRIDHTYYDRRSDIHWKLKRELNNQEKAELERRKMAGEPVYNILRDLKVIKKR